VEYVHGDGPWPLKRLANWLNIIDFGSWRFAIASIKKGRRPFQDDGLRKALKA